MLTERKIKVPIYDYQIKIIIFDAFMELVAKYPDLRDEDGTAFTVEFKDNAMVCIPSGSYQSLIHECEHLKNCVWNHIGHRPDPKNDEPDAYLIEYIYGEIVKSVQKHGPGIDDLEDD